MEVISLIYFCAKASLTLVASRNDTALNAIDKLIKEHGADVLIRNRRDEQDVDEQSQHHKRYA